MMMILMMMFFMFFSLLNFMYNYILLIYSIFLFMILIIFNLMNFNMNMNYFKKIYLFMGIDNYSFGLIILMIWIMLMVMMLSNLMIKINFIYYMILMNFILILLFLCFNLMNLILFYMMFEFSLMPLFMLILGWGVQIERINASFYMIIYTIFGSLPLMYMIILIYNNNSTLMFDLMNLNLKSYYYYMLIMAFLIKMPMYFIHMWLPKAHVEAPVIGSMILAGIMLKLGGYGLMRLIFIMNKFSFNLNILIMFSLMGSIISSIMCLYQTDMKLLVAYSSVVHMNLFIASILNETNWGLMGSYLMMLSHGLSSSSLFGLVGIIYERSNSRSLYINKGLINLFPSFSLMWFLICSSNISFPPSLNLFSEIMCINSLIFYNKNLIFIMILYCFLSALYIIYLYSYSQHGKLNIYFYLMNIKMNEFMMVVLHWIPLNLFFLMMYMYM